ncbi:MAG: ribosome maturation factor RimP [Thiobacillaceae bacterium]|nr:ribosome maturation factor RimP [Thiobacillaceae bacterium]MCX7673089.1 ribosome maturation factor RimP [Thiobacillaceae bacterium]MDW8323611.1 ribosome maturation factor RimP [Burkholderiales bacterium]
MELQTLIEPTLGGMGYELVALERVGRGLLRVYIDKPGGVDLDDCTRVSNQLTRLFAVEGVDYDRLEVSSPGLDRPLTRAGDFDRFAGNRARFKLRLPIEGRRQLIGLLLGASPEGVRLRLEAGAEVLLPWKQIESARLAPDFSVKDTARRKA